MRGARVRRIALLPCALALLAAASACGGSGSSGSPLSKADYSQRVAGVGDALEASFSDIAAEANSAASEIDSGDELTALTKKLTAAPQKDVDALGSAADELEGLMPPEDAAEANVQLAAGLRQVAGEFARLVDALESGDLAEVLDLANSLQDIASSEGAQAVEAAITELKAQGYDVAGET
jgi:hypothetical protein